MLLLLLFWCVFLCVIYLIFISKKRLLILELKIDVPIKKKNTFKVYHCIIGSKTFEKSYWTLRFHLSIIKLRHTVYLLLSFPPSRWTNSWWSGGESLRFRRRRFGQIARARAVHITTRLRLYTHTYTTVVAAAGDLRWQKSPRKYTRTPGQRCIYK